MPQQLNVHEEIPLEIHHWIPGELCLVISVPAKVAGEVLQDLYESVRIRINLVLNIFGVSLESYTLSTMLPETTSLPRTAFLFGIQRASPFVALFYRAKSASLSIDPMPLVISHILEALPQFALADLHIVSVMPNWIGTAASPSYAMGGTAIPPKPSPLHITQESRDQREMGWHFKFPEKVFPVDERKGSASTVILLDTAYSPSYIEHCMSGQEFSKNWLLQRIGHELKESTGMYTIEHDRYAITDTFTTGKGLSGDPSYYPIVDHGLFMTGIVRDIAPEARIRLVKVLNTYGVTDIYHLMACLCDIEADMYAGIFSNVIVVLGIAFLPDIRRLPYVWFGEKQWHTTELYGVSETLSYLEAGMKLLFQCITEAGAFVIASAGNDSLGSVKHGKPHRPPRAPARYPSVLGVSSVTSQNTAAPFSNIPHMLPDMDGIATFGGGVYGSVDDSGNPDAIRGVFLAPTFPDGEPNIYGWADWSGTSFSSAIVAGVVAHLVSQGYPAHSIRMMIAAGSVHCKEIARDVSLRELQTNYFSVQQHFIP